MLRIFRLLFVPVCILASAFYIYAQLDQFSFQVIRFSKYLPPGIAVLTLGLCLRFNRSRIFFSALTIVLAFLLLQWPLFNIDKDITSLALGIIVPVNILVYSLLKERGMFTWWGITRFSFLVLPVLVIYLFASWYPVKVQALLDWQFVNNNWLEMTKFSQTSMIVMFITLMLLNGRLFARPTTLNSSLFVALICSIVMLHHESGIVANAVFASASLLILLYAIVQESWSMAYLDQLTGLPGRRALDESLLKLGNNFSIAMLDVDHFKKFNDRHGHDAGDQVLRMVAARIRKNQSCGKPFRYGGEEFTLVFPGKQVEDVMAPLETVRQSICDNKFLLRSNDRRRDKNSKKDVTKNVKVTLSIGVASRNNRLFTPAEVIKGADKALYRAKKNGRNRVSK